MAWDNFWWALPTGIGNFGCLVRGFFGSVAGLRAGLGVKQLLGQNSIVMVVVPFTTVTGVQHGLYL
jgi:hypothetical protein